MEWKSDILWIGSIKVGWVNYNMLRSKSSTGETFSGFCCLPGLNFKEHKSDSKTEVIRAVELNAWMWLDAAKLSINKVT